MDMTGSLHYRWIVLTKDLRHIRWYSRRKRLKDTQIDTMRIHSILDGQQTPAFDKAKLPIKQRITSSFSIIYGKSRKSLDLIAKSPQECQMWVRRCERSPISCGSCRCQRK